MGRKDWSIFEVCTVWTQCMSGVTRKYVLVLQVKKFKLNWASRKIDSG